MKTKLLTAVLATSFATIASAYCPNDTFCVYPSSLLNQLSTKIPAAWFPGGVAANSQLCVPTSSTMAFEGLIYHGIAGSAIVTNGWLKNSFQASGTASGAYARIGVTAAKMKTSPADGTYQDPMVSALNEMGNSLVIKYNLPIVGNVDIPAAKVANTYMASINFNSIKAKFQSGFTGAVTTHGHYARNKALVSTPTLKSVTYTYVRNGGHAINLKGYIADTVVYNDPSGGLLRFSKIRTDSSYTQSSGINKKVNTLPGGAATASMYASLQDADYFPLLETFNTTTLPFKN